MPSCIRLALSAGIIGFSGLFNGNAFAQQVEYVGNYTWENPAKRFGGFSGIEVDAQGKSFTVISDRGLIADGEFIRNNAQIVGVRATFYPLKDTEGQAVITYRSDAEGLAIRSDGRIFISFENVHRVWTYRDNKSEAAWLPRHPDFKRMLTNLSLEALAVGPDNTLYAVPEHPYDHGEFYPVYRYKNGVWKVPFRIQRIGLLSPVGADFGPDGKLYILERNLGSIFGFQTRVRRFSVEESTLTDEQLILETSAGTHDNLEGLALWRDAAGDIRLTMISDDNFNIIQRTEFVEYRLKE